MVDDSIFEQLRLRVPMGLVPISSLIFDGDAPKTLCRGLLYSTNELLGLYASQDYRQKKAKARIGKAIKLGYHYLCWRKLRQSTELTCSILKCPRLQEVIMELKELFFKFQILHNFTEVKGISPKEHHILEEKPKG
jgi:hypothetical protein